MIKYSSQSRLPENRPLVLRVYVTISQQQLRSFFLNALPIPYV